MQVGVNYPWFDYGWDFGLGPPEWLGGRSTPRWYDHVDQHLARFRDLGITVVRWFVLADGLTYGTGGHAPRPANDARTKWTFEPPPLPAAAVEHFAELLRRLSRMGNPPIQLLPVFIDFHFCRPGIMPVTTPVPSRESTVDPGWVKGGRADAIADADKRTRFLENALEPLLRASREHRSVIYAWEIINEPDWVTRGWHPNPFHRLPIPEEAMRAFLSEASTRIRNSGFRPTVGFASSATMRRSGITADINQFHHYPGGRISLEPHAFDPQSPGIVGEFATAASDIWPDLKGTRQSVLNRLRLARARGYPLAMLWSYRAVDRHTRWSEDVERDLRIFAGDDRA